MKSTFALSAIAMAAALSSTSALAQDEGLRKGYIVNYVTHEWYLNVILGMEQRAEQLGHSVEVIDANLDPARQVAVAEATVCLASDLTGFTTGIDLKVDGGLTNAPRYVPKSFKPQTD